MKLFLLLIINLKFSIQITKINKKTNPTGLIKSISFYLLLEFGIKEDTINKCFNSFYNLEELLEYSGKEIGDIGNEKKCVEKDDLIYFLYLFKFDYNLIGNADDKNGKLFLGYNTYFWGLCLIKNCTDAFLFIFNNPNNKLNQTIGEFNTSSAKIFISRKNENYSQIFENKYQIGNDNKTICNNQNRKKIYDVLLLCFKIYLIIIVLFTFLKMMFFFSNDNEKKDSDIFGDDFSENYDFNTSFSKKPNKSNKIFNKEIINQDINMKKYIKIIQFLSYFDLLYNNSLFLSFKNKYYNGSSLGIIGFIRMIIMFFIVFKFVFFFSTNVFIQNDIMDLQKYQSSLFIFVKLSFFSSISWIVLDGTIFGFKFSSFIKKEQKTLNINVITILKYYLYLIPKIFVFLIIYIYFDILCIYDKKSNILQNYYTYLKQQYKCFEKPFKILLTYSFNINNNYFNNYENQCYGYTFILINEFYSIIILSIIVLLSYKLKSKIIDCLFTFLLIINLFTIQYFYFKDNHTKDYKYIEMNIFFGQNFYEKYTHLFFSVFFLGFLIGNIIFYYHDIVSSTYNSNEFIPFSFTIDIMNIINNLEFLTKSIISIILSVILIFISYIPLFFKNYFGKIEDNENLEIQKKINILLYVDIYEKAIFIIIFSILLIFLKLIFEHSFLSSFLQSKFIFTFEKIKIVFFCFIETFLGYSFTLFKFKFDFTYRNLIYISFGLYVLAFIFCYSITLLFEFPIIKIIKYFTKTKENNITINEKVINDNLDLHFMNEISQINK